MSCGDNLSDDIPVVDDCVGDNLFRDEGITGFERRYDVLVLGFERVGILVFVLFGGEDEHEVSEFRDQLLIKSP